MCRRISLALNNSFGHCVHFRITFPESPKCVSLCNLRDPDLTGFPQMSQLTICLTTWTFFVCVLRTCLLSKERLGQRGQVNCSHESMSSPGSIGALIATSGSSSGMTSSSDSSDTSSVSWTWILSVIIVLYRNRCEATISSWNCFICIIRSTQLKQANDGQPGDSSSWKGNRESISMLYLRWQDTYLQFEPIKDL